jgi:hypothetical protein
VSALFGLIGVLAGVGIASGFGFWSTRREELEAAVVAATIVVDELQMTRDSLAEHDAGKLTAIRLTSLASFWLDHRDALVLYLQPVQFSALNRVISLAVGRSSAVPEDARQLDEEIAAVLTWLTQRASELREAHQAFILTPLIKYLRSRPWRRKDADESLRLSQTD